MPFKKGKTGNPKGKPMLTDEQKINKEYFQSELKKHSVSALETIISLMENSSDNTIRLRCATYILDKTLGKEFHLFETTEQTKDFVVKITTVDSDHKIDTDWIEQQISSVELEEENNNFDSEDDWGNDIY